MNIVIISNILPWPLNSGGAQAQYNIIDNLRKVHKISFLFTHDGKNKLKYMKELQQVWPDVELIPYLYIDQLLHWRFVYDKMVRALKLFFTPNSESFQIERALKPYGVYFNNRFIRFVNNVISQRNADLVEVNFYPCLHIATYLPTNVRKIFIHHEIRFVRNERLLQPFSLSDKDKQRKASVKHQEILDLNEYDEVITLTETDKKVLLDNGVTVPVSVSPAAVNATSCDYEDWKGHLTFIGGFAHIPNQEGIEWFIKHVFHNDSFKDIPLKIVGAGWPACYRDTNKNIELLGFVDDLREVVAGSIMIVPILTGSGMRMKILEAAAMSVPFITTSVGVEGLDFKHEYSCLIADTADEFALAIKRLTSDPELRRNIAINAHQTYIERYSVDALSKIRNNIYNREP